MISHFSYNLTIHYTDAFDPKYSIERRGLDLNDNENNCKYIIEDTRYLYEYAFQRRMHKVSYMEKLNMETECSDIVKTDYE